MVFYEMILKILDMKKYFTSKGIKKLKEQLKELKTIKRKEIAQKLKEASSFGDLSENAAYHEAKESQVILEGKILELERLIKNAVIIEKKEKTGWVQIGSKVFVNSENKEQIFKIVGANESNPSQGEISYDSPLGRVFLDKPEGAVVEVEIPKGKIKYKILKIE